MDLPLVLVVALALIFGYTSGFHDAANAIATSVSTRALTPRIALALGAAANLVGADFTDARTVDLTFEEVMAIDARLPKVSFRDRRLTRVDLSGALLEGADFRDAVFEDCSLRDAQLARTRFEGADLRGADLGGIRLGDAAHFRGAIISRAQATMLLQELGLRVL